MSKPDGKYFQYYVVIPTLKIYLVTEMFGTATLRESTTITIGIDHSEIAN